MVFYFIEHDMKYNICYKLDHKYGYNLITDDINTIDNLIIDNVIMMK